MAQALGHVEPTMTTTKTGDEPTGLLVLRPDVKPSELASGGRRPGWDRGPVVALVVAALALGAGGMALGVAALLRSPSQGAQGLAGAAGVQGTPGPHGAQGVQGVVGPQGPPGEAGPRGATGPAGPDGARGATGRTGPAGTIAASTVVSAAELKTTADPAVGTTLSATTACPGAEVLLGGGAKVAVSPTKKNSPPATGGPNTTSDTRKTGPGAAPASSTHTASGSSGSPGTSHTPPTVALESSYPMSTGWRTVAVVTGSVTGGEVMTLQPYALCGKK